VASSGCSGWPGRSPTSGIPTRWARRTWPRRSATGVARVIRRNGVHFKVLENRL